MGYTTGMLGRTSESERCTHRSSGGRASAVTYLRVTEPGGARSSSPSFPPPPPHVAQCMVGTHLLSLAVPLCILFY